MQFDPLRAANVQPYVAGIEIHNISLHTYLW